jgi:NADH-quinone oxidoreductase subunit G
VVIAGAASGAPAVVEAAAAIAQALGERGGLVLVPPEANSMGLALLADAGLEHACALLESGTARALLVVEADLFERAPSPLVERVLDAAQRIVVLDCLETRTTARADVVLPVAAFTEAAGTFVNHEGRAQRLVAAIESGPPAAWRRLGVLGAGGWTTLDELLADLARLRPDLAGVRDAAPPASFRTTSGRIARTPRPFSGHTADDRAGRVPEAVPPEDPDSALAWGMEGARGLGLPAALLTAYTTPGLSSANAVTRFLEEIEGPLRGGDPGVLLLASGDGDQRPASALEPVAGEGEGLLLVPLHDPFTGTETARASPLLAARAPAPRLVLHPQDAAALGLVDGDAVTLDGRPCAVPISLDPGLARGVLGASVGTLAPRGALRRVRVERAR